MVVSEPRGNYDFTPPPPSFGEAWTDFIDPAADTYRRRLDLAEFTEPRFHRPIRRGQALRLLRDVASSFFFGMVLIYGALAGLWLWSWAGLPFWFRLEILQ